MVTQSTPTIEASAVPGPPPLLDPPRPRDGTRRRRLRNIAAGALLVAGIAWAVRGLDATILWAALASARPGWVAFAAAVNLCAIVLQAARWLALVRPIAPTATLGAAFKSMLVGSTVSIFVPARAGELARVQWLSRRTGVPRAPLLGSVLLDYLLNAAGLMLGLAVLPFVLAVPPWIRRGILLTFALFTVGVLVVLAARPAARGSLPSTWRGPLGRVVEALARARHGLVATSDPGALARSFGACLASWIVELGVIAATARAMGLQVPLSACLVVLMAVNLALAIPFAPPANVGTLELGASLALMGFGVPKEKALAFGVVYHLLQILPIVALGAFFAGRASRGAGLENEKQERAAR